MFVLNNAHRAPWSVLSPTRTWQTRRLLRRSRCYWVRLARGLARDNGQLLFNVTVRDRPSINVLAVHFAALRGEIRATRVHRVMSTSQKRGPCRFGGASMPN